MLRGLSLKFKENFFGLASYNIFAVHVYIINLKKIKQNTSL